MSIAAKLIIDFIAEDSDKSDYKILEDFMVNKLSAWDKRSVNEILESDLHTGRLRDDWIEACESKTPEQFLEYASWFVSDEFGYEFDPDNHDSEELTDFATQYMNSFNTFEMAEQAATLLDLNEYLYQRIWFTFMDDHDIPDDFENTAYGNDAAPSISHKSGRIMVWFHDQDTWDDIGWHDELKKYQVHYHPTEQAYGEYGEGYTNKSVNTWAEVLEIIEEWRATQTKDEPQTYKDSFEGDQCPECGEFSVSGEVFRATGAKLDSGYQPSVGETLKFISMECSECDFDQYS